MNCSDVPVLARTPLRDDGTIRLSSALAATGLFSRKQARRAHPEVDGVSVKSSARISLGDGRVHRIVVGRYTFLLQRDHALVMSMHVPRGVVTGRESQEGPTVFEVLPQWLYTEHLEPVGRLDKDTSGLLLLTEDGRLNQRLRHPSRRIARTYRAELVRPVAPDDAQAARVEGVVLKDGQRVMPHALRCLDDGNRKMWEISLTEGRYHEARRFFAALGSHVQTLHRHQYGPLHLVGDESPTALVFEGGLPRCTTVAFEGDHPRVTLTRGLEHIDGAARHTLFDTVQLDDVLCFAQVSLRLQ